MARDAKTQPLTIRLDEKTRFILDFIARAEDRTLTAVIERALKKAGDSVEVAPSKDWRCYWDASEGVRYIKLLIDPDVQKNGREELEGIFLRIHKDLFFTDAVLSRPRQEVIDIIWPRFSSLVDLWLERRSQDYWGVWREVAKLVEAAGISGLPALPRSGGDAALTAELDDEILY